MSEHLPDDELVSAVLDGEATEEQRAQLEARPDLQARLVQLSGVAGWVASHPLPEPTTSDADRQVAYALGVAATVLRPVARVPAASRRPPTWALAAAAIALVVLVPLGVLAATRDGGPGPGDDLAAPPATTSTSVAPATSAPLATLAPGTTTPTTEAPVRSVPGTGPTGLAAIDDPEELAEVAADIVGAIADEEEQPQTTTSLAPGTTLGATTTTSTTLPSFDCLAVLGRDDGVLPELVAVVDVTYQGQPRIMVISTDGKLTSAVVVDPESCRVVALTTW